MARKIVGPKGAQSGGTTSVPEVIVSVKPPETADDHILLALEKTGLDAVVRTLRDWCGSREIRNSLNRLSHRDPVDPFKHIQRHAVEIYAKQHDLTPAKLMVKLVGEGGRKDAAGSERYKLRKAREFLQNNENAHIAAGALADHWENSRPEKRDPTKHLKRIRPDI